MPTRVPIPPVFRQHPPEPPTTTLTTPPPRVPVPVPVPVPDRGSRLTRSGRFCVKLEDLRPFLSACPACAGPSVRLRIDVPAEDLQPPGWPAPNFEEVAGFGRYFQPNICSACELKEILGRLIPPSPAPMVVDPAQEELARLRRELTPPAASEAPAPIAGALFRVAEPVVVTKAASESAGRLAGSEALAEAYCRELLALHCQGDHGLVGQHLDGDPRAGSGQNPLASQADRNAASIEEGRGSIRSVYRRTRVERWKDPNSGFLERSREIRAEFGIRTELPAGLTAIGLVSEIQGSG